MKIIRIRWILIGFSFLALIFVASLILAHIGMASFDKSIGNLFLGLMYSILFIIIYGIILVLRENRDIKQERISIPENKVGHFFMLLIEPTAGKRTVGVLLLLGTLIMLFIHLFNMVIILRHYIIDTLFMKIFLGKEIDKQFILFEYLIPALVSFVFGLYTGILGVIFFNPRKKIISTERNIGSVILISLSISGIYNLIASGYFINFYSYVYDDDTIFLSGLGHIFAFFLATTIGAFLFFIIKKFIFVFLLKRKANTFIKPFSICLFISALVEINRYLSLISNIKIR